jgi:hypothetical protein
MYVCMLCVYVCIYAYMHVRIYVFYVCMYVYVCIYIKFSPPLLLYICFLTSLSYPPILSTHPALLTSCLFNLFIVYVCLCVSLCVYLSLFVSIYLYLSLCVSICVYLSLCVCICVYLHLPIRCSSALRNLLSVAANQVPIHLIII